MDSDTNIPPEQIELNTLTPPLKPFMDRNSYLLWSRARALALAGTLMLLLSPPDGNGAPAGTATLISTNAFGTNGVSQAIQPKFRLPTREDLQRQEQVPIGAAPTGSSQRRKSTPPPMNPLQRAQIQQQVDEFLAQRERETPPAPAGPQIAERGPHHNRWETYQTILNVSGRREVRTNSYVELATGLNRAEGGEWVPAKALVELAPGGAVATQGAHQASFGANANRAGFIEVLTPDGRRLKSHVLGLFYYETTTGRSVQLTGLKDSPGAVHPPNMVVYADAFKDLKADLRYTYKLHGFEQDVILRERPPSPADFGFDPEETELVVLTEFVVAPEPVRTGHVLKRKVRQGQEVDGLSDETLEFGAMMMGPGKAFQLGDQGRQDPGKAGSLIPVGKRWLKKDGRTYLLESVDYPDLKPHLPQLPLRPEARNHRPAVPLDKMLAAFDAPPAKTEPLNARMQMASLPLTGPGLVVDYDLLTTTTNLTFRGDTTYYVSGAVALYGTTTIEGGAVVKYAPTNSTYLSFYGPVSLKTTDFRPAVFTARDDDTIGETITGSTGAPSGYYASTALSFSVVTNAPLTLENLRIAHANYSVAASYRGFVTYRNLQVINCNVGPWGGNVGMKMLNCLVANTIFGAVGENTQPIQVENCTFNTCSNAFYVWGSSAQVKATNNIFASVTSYGVYSSLAANYNGLYNAPALTQNNGFTNGSSPFQGVGGASYYLATNSAWRNVGTAAIDSLTVSAIQPRTTEAPLVVSGWLSGNNTYAKRVARDTDTPDLGYHYAPLDYVFAACALTNEASVKIKAGTSIGVANTFTNGSNYYGLFLNPADSSSYEFQSFGLPSDPNRFVLFNAVQESAYVNWNQNISGLVVTTTNSWVTGECRFTEFIVPGKQSIGTILAEGTTPVGSFSLRHASFLGGTLGLGALDCDVFNCLFDRAAVSGTTAGTNTFFNNTFLDGSADFTTPPSVGSIILKDNLFVRSLLSSTNSVTHSHNGYVTNYSRLSPAHSNDVVVTSIDFQPGALGACYLPTNSAFINAGSRNATNAGLYHFTTATNQTKEGSSTVDFGLHYVAVNGSGLPVDTDGDGLPDYFEDWNGNGLLTAGETYFTNSYSFSASLPDGLVDLDYDGVTAIQEYQGGTDPTDGAEFIFEPRMLGRWRFDTAALTGDQGQVPRYTNNVSVVSSWNTNAVLISGSNTTTRLLNVDYAASTDTNLYKWGMAAYGLTTNDYWYPYYNPWVTDVTITNLLWSDQSALPSGAKVRVQNAPGQWGTNTGDYMYNGYVYDWDGAGIPSTYSGLPGGRYDLYLYGHGAYHDQNTIFSVFTASRDFGSNNTIFSYNWASIVWSNTLQYVLFPDVTVVEGETLQINAAHLNAWYYGINGMQLANRTASRLAYREVETNGLPNINLKRGTVMFWVKPGWTSGTGPGHEGRLLEVGDQGSTNGWWALYCSTNGSELNFSGKAGTNTTNYLTSSIDWTTNWVHVALTYTETNSALYVDGELATEGEGVSLLPGLTTRFLTGLNVGGDFTGWNNVRGQMEDMKTYNYPLSAGEVDAAYQADINSAGYDKDGDGVPNYLDADPSNPGIGRIKVKILYPASGLTVF